MKTQPVVPAVWQRNHDGLPWSAEFADLYHPAAGAFRQAEHVFIAGNGLPERWRGRDRFVVLETGFGLGNNFLATWRAWRQDAQACDRLHFISIERHPLRGNDLRDAHRGSPVPELAEALIDAWPPLTPNLHRLDFEAGRVQLLLAFGDVSTWLPELIAEVDAFYLDGFAPARNPEMWQPRVFKAMARLAVAGATVATWTAARAVREGLTAAGFDTRQAQGTGGKRDITLARYAPGFTPRRSPPRFQKSTDMSRHAVVIGAGLAGCATAWALAEQGWTSTVIDRQAAPAHETSGNPAGLFHASVHPQDGPHARFSRAAAFHVERAARVALARHAVAGQIEGLLRLTDGHTTLDSMLALLVAQGLPAEFIRALDVESARSACGLDVEHPAWFYPGGGWISPAGLARSFLERAGARVEFRGGVGVDSLSKTDTGWSLCNADGDMVEQAETVVLANAGEALRLISQLDGSTWPVESARGQISVASTDSSIRPPRIPIAGSGYLTPEVNGDIVFGATSQVGDVDGNVRLEDHLWNIAQLAKLCGSTSTKVLETSAAIEKLRGRVGWRQVSRDRLPLIGGVPDPVAAAAAPRIDHPHQVPRYGGLFMFTALGSRGITWSALGARILASAITGGPCPVESSLLDSIDAARFLARDARC